ncbi:hypothetical protein Sjap_012719 [Stephania japonica]|uniref:Uncharacterized protein n=1 Tax=Stephania japonica TaxID=461633 RepID=A0AAP0IWF3_9MAGN
MCPSFSARSLQISHLNNLKQAMLHLPEESLPMSGTSLRSNFFSLHKYKRSSTDFHDPFLDFDFTVKIIKSSQR